MLKIENLSVGYNLVHVLDHIDLSLKQGETFGLIGLNGAGKTTLIKTILGLRQPTNGQIRFIDHTQNTLSETQAKSKTAYLPERFEPPRFLNGYEFIKFSASFYNTSINKEEIDQTATQLGLALDALPRSVNSYSKGMRQKLGLIATIMTGCDYLILDEPMSGLDPKARVLVKDTINMLKKQGRTIFLSSHILADMHEICDTVSVLHNQKIQFTGTPQDMIKKYNATSLERAFLKIIEHESTSEKNAA